VPCFVAVGVLQPRFKYQNKSDMCTKNWPKNDGWDFSHQSLHPSELLSKLEAIDGMSTSDPVKSGFFGGWHQVPLGSHVGENPSDRMGNKGQESWNQRGYAILSLFGWRERT